jgi:hypothetical protein
MIKYSPIRVAPILLIVIANLSTAAHADDVSRDLRTLWGTRYSAPKQAPNPHKKPPSQPRLDVVRHWNEIAISACGIDHTPPAAGESRVFAEQYGPGRSSRAMAIVHTALFDAVNAIDGGYRGYTDLPPAPQNTSLDAAAAQAAHDTLAALYPAQAQRLHALLADDLRRIPNKKALANGVDVGRRAASAVLALRAKDGAHKAEARVGIEYLMSEEPGMWRQDPISHNPFALGYYWGSVTPFVLRSSDQFRIPPPPAMDSLAYADAFEEVKRLGGDGIITPTERTPDQTMAGIFWAYDGTPSLCSPPRLFNQIAVQIAVQRKSSLVELARLLALVNVAMADAGVAGWESKYYYQLWRPITGIREADGGTGPTGRGDSNPETVADATFTPLGAPASNLNGPNFTPPFPSYPSGHACFGGAVFQTLRNFYGTDNIAFTFVSDELNGVTRDNEGNIRPLLPRHFSTLSQAEEENGQSRIYLGIHWSFDKTEGIKQGRNVANYVFRNTFQPLQKKRR